MFLAGFALALGILLVGFAVAVVVLSVADFSLWGRGVAPAPFATLAVFESAATAVLAGTGEVFVYDAVTIIVQAIAELGLPQTPIETAVRDSVEWFRANGYA